MSPPFSRRRLLMGSHEGTVEQEVGGMAVGCEGRKHPLPHPGSRPARKALMDTLPVAVALRQVAPPRSAAFSSSTATISTRVFATRPANLKHIPRSSMDS